MTSPKVVATTVVEKCTTTGSCTRTLTLLLQYKNSKVRRDKIIVSSLSELEQFIRQELQIPTHEELILRYYDSDFDENVDLETLATLPDKAKLEVIPKETILASPSLSTTYDQVVAPTSVYPTSTIPSASPAAVAGFFPPLNIDPQLHLLIQQQLLEQGFVPPTVGFGALPLPFVPPSPSVVGGVGGFAYPYNGASEEEQVLLLQLQQLQLQQQQLQIESSQLQQQFFQPFDSTSAMAVALLRTGAVGGGLGSAGGDEEEDGGFTSPMMDSGTGEGWMVAKPPSSSSPSSAGILASSSSSKTSTGSLSPIDGSPSSSPAIGRRLSQASVVPPSPSSQREGPKVPPKNLSAFIKSISLSPLKKSIVFKIFQDMLDKGLRDLVKDHKQLFKTFPKTLNGEELVNFLVTNSIAKDVPEAINTAQQLINFDLLVPVTDKTGFKAFKINLYRLHEDDTEISNSKGGPSVASLRKTNGAICGYIFKKAGIRFKKRYIVVKLDEQKLYIFKTRHDSSPRQVVALQDMLIYLRGTGDITPGLYSFVMSGPLVTTVFATKKQEDQEAWMSALQAGGALYVDDSVINAGPITYSFIYEFIVDDIDGNPFDLSSLRGKVCLIVNVASKCGLTCKTYKGLQDLYDRNNSKGLVILGFPCNQFGRQEPGTNTEIRDFARNNLKVTFPLFSKIKVNGEKSHPLYRFLRSKVPGILGDSIKWNFTKFLVDSEGTPLKRFSPATSPSAIEPHILQLFFGGSK